MSILDRADAAVTKMQISAVIVNGFENGFHQWIQRIFLVVMEATKMTYCVSGGALNSTHSPPKSARARECDCGRLAGTRPRRPFTNSSFHTSDSNYSLQLSDPSFFTATLFHMFKETPTEELIEANRHCKITAERAF